MSPIVNQTRANSPSEAIWRKCRQVNQTQPKSPGEAIFRQPGAIVANCDQTRAKSPRAKQFGANVAKCESNASQVVKRSDLAQMSPREPKLRDRDGLVVRSRLRLDGV
ncbi:hypothetical protein AVEN_269880-1 [Araneus ventricosus]|uniref:Uncharacterized protein n=1 Tax=Araneus ventricosus TaxID=182803 RepID=A0A4Y2RET2_ARAVE|nr:hypothetical protein AVEN_269880-1 [Araneus ventricosus]